MRKVKHGKRHKMELEGGLIAAIDKTIECAIMARMEDIDSRIDRAITICLLQKSGGSTKMEPVRRLFNPEAGP